MAKESNAAPIYVPPKSGAKELLKPIWLVAISMGQYRGQIWYPGQKFSYNGKVKYRINRNGEKEYMPPHWTELVDEEDNKIIVKDDKNSESAPVGSDDSDKPLNAKELSAKIKESDDVAFIEAQLEDSRKSVKDAAEKRLAELEGPKSASDFV